MSPNWIFSHYQSIIRRQSTMAILGGATIGFFSLPILYLGLEFLWLGLRCHIGHPFHVSYGYFTQGGIWLVWGFLILALCFGPLLRRKRSIPALVLAFILLCLAAIAIPSNRMPGDIKNMAESGVVAAVRRTNTTLTVGADDAGRFPATQSELEEWVKKSADTDWGKKSLYARDSVRLPYRLVYIADAAGPRKSPVNDDPPGTVYCAVRRDQKKVWISGTVLDEAVAGNVIMLPSDDRSGPWIEENQIDTPAVSHSKQEGAETPTAVRPR